MRTKTGFLNRNLKLCLFRVRFLLSLILKPSKQDSLWGEAVLVLVFSCDAGTAGGDGCQESAVALAGHSTQKGALAGTATAGELLSARMP